MHQLPTYAELQAWTQLLVWAIRLEETGMTLCKQALDSGEDPASRYRLVRRLTGVPWTTVREMGTDWLLSRISEVLRVEIRRQDLGPAWSLRCRSDQITVLPRATVAEPDREA
jgi:hypothetical protein